MMAPKRKYALTKIAPGDYLLPSNDGKTIWRICRYTEGPSTGIEDWPRDKEVWSLWQWEKPNDVLGPVMDTGDWSQWEFWDGLYATRAEAIKAALKASTPMDGSDA